MVPRYLDYRDVGKNVGYFFLVQKSVAITIEDLENKSHLAFERGVEE